MARQIAFLALVFLAVVGFACAEAPTGGPVFSPGDAAGDQIGNVDDAAGSSGTPIGSPKSSGSGGNDAAVEAPVGGPVTDQGFFGPDAQGPSSGASKAVGFLAVAGVAAAGAVVAGFLFS